MNKINYLIISFLTLALGIIFFAYQEGFIVLRTPGEIRSGINSAVHEKKQVKLFYWYQDAWHHETMEIVWPEQKALAVEYLLNSWLGILDEENVSSEKIAIQSVILAPNEQELYISLTRNPFSSQDIAFNKWMWIEGLLKTIRENVPNIQRVRFLIQHKTFTDAHLDFVNPWPIHGFLNS